MVQPHIVVVDDDPAVRDVVREMLKAEGYEVTVASDGASAIRVVKETPVQAVITDLKMPGMDGIEILERVSQLDSQIACIVMTGYGTIDIAVQAMKAGAFDFVTKPLHVDAVSVVVKKALDFQRMRQENVLLRKTVRERHRLEQFVGKSSAVTELHEFIMKVADSNSTVLILGESGTGKELVARLLHYNSVRRDHPLVPVNCGAIPETLLESELFGHEKGAFTGATNARIGRFEMAHGGTIFLDEVGEMSPQLQVKLLRVLQERCFERVGGTKTVHVDVRILAASNQDLDQAVQEHRFRPDLFYRLNVIPVTIPPLRERQRDIPLLIDHFLSRFNAEKRTDLKGVEPKAMVYLMQHTWPGNVRELENLIERVVILKKTGMMTVADLPEKIGRDCSASFGPVPRLAEAEPIGFNGTGIHLVMELEQYENRLIAEALRQSNGVASKAAQLLHMNRTTLVEKMKRKGFFAKFQGQLFT